MALSALVPDGERKGDLSKQHFVNIFSSLKTQLSIDNMELTSAYFSSSSQDASKLSRLIIEAASLVV